MGEAIIRRKVQRKTGCNTWLSGKKEKKRCPSTLAVLARKKDEGLFTKRKNVSPEVGLVSSHARKRQKDDGAFISREEKRGEGKRGVTTSRDPSKINAIALVVVSTKKKRRKAPRRRGTP